jgi:hypothetical protein
MVAKLVKEFVLVFFLVIYSISCWLLSWPTLLVCEGELVGPPFPEIDYVADDVGIERSIMLEEFKPKKMDSDDVVVQPELDHGDEHGVVPTNAPRPVTPKAVDGEDRLLLALASAKFHLCCLQANVDCPGTAVCLRQRNGGMKMQTKLIIRN